jgi:hypothetical protein
LRSRVSIEGSRQKVDVDQHADPKHGRNEAAQLRGTLASAEKRAQKNPQRDIHTHVDQAASFFGR